MSPRFEAVLEQVKTLSEPEQAELLRALARPKINKNGSRESRLEKIRAFRGRFRGILPSTEEFMAEKRQEVELEESKWRR